ncbi:MAG: 2-amino-4-hydroxy-6-hydroxymethyldihydropteridine diphosphokinase [Clostridiales bacterium]|nr:2-amino-4-hydroxy-6-hydroxymethyldihydropteridine diphosphokinase [Clostridiales bacterium]
MAEIIYLSLGSNMGDRKQNLCFAVKRLSEQPALSLKRKSSLYLTEPWGEPNQEKFYNAVLEMETASLPWELLAICQQIERETGRERLVHWGPRTLDIDILWYGGQHIVTGDLHVPHPYLSERLYVMCPLSELVPHLEIPLKGRLDLLLAAYPDKTGIEVICAPEEW